ncbi:MAG: hypothetical protein JW797_07395 [Bradymonadales bacterium]|nr:hypothetical protein [Bradymonadales bacterium]
MDEERDRVRRDTIAQWAFDTRPILARFHLWLEDVAVEWIRGEPVAEFTRDISFLGGQMERLFCMVAAVTTLGTQLFGRYGEGAGLDRRGLNQVKKDADAISAYAMSEGLWSLSRWLPENHAIMVCLGEGLMPKEGEVPEWGANPQLGFGRVYARPQVAQWLERRVVRLFNDPRYDWPRFYRDIKEAGITVWGTAIDTLENTTRFARGEVTGPMTVLHVFDQPLRITRPYEGFMGNLVIPRAVEQQAAERSLLIDFRTSRAKVIEAIEWTYPGIRREHIHVWTLRGASRAVRIQGLWDEWQQNGAHLVEEGWVAPTGLPIFTDSGTYAPAYLVGSWRDDQGCPHVFLTDGYSASTETLAAASLAPMLELESTVAVFTSLFQLPYDRERRVVGLDPASDRFESDLAELAGRSMEPSLVEEYREAILDFRNAGLETNKPVIQADDFFPEKRWEVVALSGYMRSDPYSGAQGVRMVGPDTYAVTVRFATRLGDKRVTLTLRLMEDMAQSRLIFNPLLNRFMAGEDFRKRPVKISDSGRIRNELQTLCSYALEYTADGKIRVVFDKISPDVIPPEHQRIMLDVLRWYRKNHPIWFSWLQIAHPRQDPLDSA